MTIRLTFFIVFATLMALLAVQLQLSRQIIAKQAEIVEGGQRRYASFKVADELRQTSDDLTRMARTYVVTQDPAFEGHFKDILAIRNGTQPRPAGCATIYWDFIVAGQKHGAPGRSVALRDMMRELGFTKAELDELDAAQARSDALVDLEARAMAAVKGLYPDAAGQFTVRGEPRLEYARELVHGEEYHQAKSEIMQPIAAFFRLLEGRTMREVQALYEQAGVLLRRQFVLGGATVLLALLFYIFLELRVSRGITGIANRMLVIAQGEGDLTQRVDTARRDEIGRLGRAFNGFVQQVHDIVGNVRRSTMEVASAATQIAATAQEESRLVQQYSGWTAQAAAAVRQIQTTSLELNGHVQQVGGLARQAVGRANTGRGRLAELDARIQDVSRFTESVAAQLRLIEARTTKIGVMLHTIIKVSDQTDILSVNAGLEAERAGAHGRGFGVVAEEIRRLADQTSTAALEVEQNVKDMNESVTTGVKDIGAFSEMVTHSVETAEHVGKQLADIIQDVEALGSKFDEVTHGVAAQASGADQITESVVQIDRGASELSSSISEFAQVASSLRETIAELERNVGEFKTAGQNGPEPRP